ncbi:MAG: penicillin acylase family protein, partial [bacterium]|nr:penicillin acylase family protein [bacterium]
PRWRLAGATHLHHPLANLGIHFFDPGEILGWGDAYAVKVQTQVYGQSLRAVWEPGEWSAGGMVFPVGESGRPRSPHYRDLLRAWSQGVMSPFPLRAPAASERGVQRLRLVPRGPRPSGIHQEMARG